MIEYLVSTLMMLSHQPQPDQYFTGHRLLTEDAAAGAAGNAPILSPEQIADSLNNNSTTQAIVADATSTLASATTLASETTLASVTTLASTTLARTTTRAPVKLGTYAWNDFRIAGDFLHLVGILFFIFTVLKKGTVEGFSKKTHVCYFLIFVTRYLDLFVYWHAMPDYLRAFKITFIILSTISLVLFWVYRSTYEKPKDTCSLFLILIACLILMVLLAKKPTFLEYMWTFSEILEAVCLVPQYVFRYRDNANTDMGVFIFIFCLGGYRVLYMFNWIYRKIENPQYTDVRSWIAGVVEILFFADFLAYRLKGFSILRTFVLGVDDRITWVHDSVEFRILGKTDDDEEHHNQDSELRQRKKPRNLENELEEFDPTEV